MNTKNKIIAFVLLMAPLLRINCMELSKIQEATIDVFITFCKECLTKDTQAKNKIYEAMNMFSPPYQIAISHQLFPLSENIQPQKEESFAVEGVARLEFSFDGTKLIARRQLCEDCYIDLTKGTKHVVKGVFFTERESFFKEDESETGTKLIFRNGNITFDYKIETLCLNIKRSELISRTDRGDIVVYDVKNGKEQKRFADNAYDLQNHPFNQDIFAVRTKDGSVVIRSTILGQLCELKQRTCGMTFHPTGNIIYLVKETYFGGDLNVNILDFKEGTWLDGFTIPSRSDKLRNVHCNGRLLSIATEDEVQLWNLATKKLATTIKKNTTNIINACFSPNGTKLAVADMQEITMYSIEYS